MLNAEWDLRRFSGGRKRGESRFSPEARDGNASALPGILSGFFSGFPLFWSFSLLSFSIGFARKSPFVGRLANTWPVKFVFRRNALLFEREMRYSPSHVVRSECFILFPH